ncbi:hypothetical protein HK104_002556 [Borealophlyctis nickersoniae]|nr:hypothetical protein HK104_002556 [Borealophlyctis nickersoniae]
MHQVRRNSGGRLPYNTPSPLRSPVPLPPPNESGDDFDLEAGTPEPLLRPTSSPEFHNRILDSRPLNSHVGDESDSSDDNSERSFSSPPTSQPPAAAPANVPSPPNPTPPADILKSTPSSPPAYNPLVSFLLHLHSIPPTHPIAIWTDRFVLLVHVYNLIVVPLTVAWTCALMSPTIYAFSYLGDAILLWGMGVKCFVEFDDEFGIVEKDTKAIARKWLVEDMGWLHVVGSFPWDAVVLGLAMAEGKECQLLGSPDLWRIWALVRVLRFIPMSRLAKCFLDWKVPRMPIPISRLFKNILFVIVIAHLSACSFWVLSSSGTPYDSWVVHKQLIVDANNQEVPLFRRYLMSYYSSQKALFFSLREMYSEAEKVYTIIETLIAAVVNGSLFGNLSSIIRHMDSSAAEHKAAEAHQFQTRTLEKYMQDKAFPPELQERILSHNHHSFIRTLGMDEQNVFAGLPKVLTQDVANHLYYDLVLALPLFKGCDSAFISSITRAVKPLTLLAGWYVFRKDDEAQEMYFIRNGSVEVCSADGMTVFVTLKTGGFFGEIALLENCKRTASVRAAVNTDLCFLSRSDFEDLLNAYPIAREQIMRTVEERKEADRKRAAEAAEAKRVAEEQERAKQRAKELKEAKAKRSIKKGKAPAAGGLSKLSVGLGSKLSLSRNSIGGSQFSIGSAGKNRLQQVLSGLRGSRQSGMMDPARLSEILQNSQHSIVEMMRSPSIVEGRVVEVMRSPSTVEGRVTEMMRSPSTVEGRVAELMRSSSSGEGRLTEMTRSHPTVRDMERSSSSWHRSRGSGEGQTQGSGLALELPRSDSGRGRFGRRASGEAMR